MSNKRIRRKKNKARLKLWREDAVAFIKAHFPEHSPLCQWQERMLKYHFDKPKNCVITFGRIGGRKSFENLLKGEPNGSTSTKT